MLGLLSISSRAYLIAISRRKEVAQIQGKPIYVIQDVALIPLASQSEANAAISEARKKLHQYIEEGNIDATAENESLLEDGSSSLGGEEVNSGSPVTPPPEPEKTGNVEKGHKQPTSVVEDVIGKRGAYGRFADKWFSSVGWSADKKRALGMSMSSEEDVSKNTAAGDHDDVARRPAETSEAPSLNTSTIKGGEVPSPKEHDKPPDDMSMVLLPKTLRTARLLFSSKSFYYSHEHDLSHSLWKQPNPGSTAPLFKQFDPLVCRYSRSQQSIILTLPSSSGIIIL